jgi:ribose 5-phosphate isomerase B
MSIQANRYSVVRCALCWNREIARQAKEHLNANIISMPGKYIDIKTAKEIIDVWRKTKTLTLEKHKRRINKLEIL